jgi:hypothetical protein
VSGASSPTGNHFNIIKNNTYIKGILLPSTLTSVGDYAFNECTSLTSVSFPSGIATVGERAFYGCTNLTGIVIPASVTSIATYAFGNCTALTTVTFEGNTAKIANVNAFPNGANLLTAAGATANSTPAQAGTYTLEGSTWTKTQ